MSFQLPTILALDFDGVVLDGLVEYFATTKKTYQQIWRDCAIDEELAPRFYRLRPVIETGWEMPLLLRALVLDIDEGVILRDWSAVVAQIMRTERLDKQVLAQKLDSVRDSWIEEDLEGWLGLHRFFPGIIPRLQQIIDSLTKLYIVTTKEGRFTRQLLQQQQIDLPAANIIGKESQRPKYETLRILKDTARDDNISIWFVEDRLKALQQVTRQPDLQPVTRLFLADWGYNIERDRQIARQDSQIQLLSLQQFGEDFSNW
ncbi:HAD family hydrolase [Myxosarcina sp. GI1(2024)]